MAYLSQLLSRITDILISPKISRERDYHVLCIFLKCESRIFLEKNSEYLIPLMTSISPVLDMTSELEKLKRFISLLFKLDIKKMYISHKPFTLNPIDPRTFHVAVINITGEQAEKLLNHKENNLVEVPENYLYLNRDNNFLYNIYCNKK